MYYEYGYGAVVKRLRNEKGLTQFELAERLDCHDSTISHIENESQEPKVSTLRRIMEYLGDPGFSSAYFFEIETLKVLDIQCHLIESYELNDIETFENLLDEYNQIYDKQDVLAVQFFEFIKLLYFEKIYPDTKVSAKSLAKVLNKTIEYPKAHYDASKLLLGRTEIYILNVIAITYIREGNYYKAKQIILLLIRISDKSRHFFPLLHKIRAGLYNNLALCECYVGHKETSIGAINKAVSYLSKEGGLLFALKIFRTKWLITKTFENFEKANRERLFLKICHNRLSKSIRRNNKFSDFMSRECAIDLF